MNRRAMSIGLAAALVAWLASSHVCRAEYVEQKLAKRLGVGTLIGLGVPALVLDGYSVSYAMGGGEQEKGRRIVFALQIAEAVAMPLAGVTWYYLAGSGAENPDTSMKLITAGHLVLGVASLALGIAARPRVVAESGTVATRPPSRVTWLVMPTPIVGNKQQGVGFAFAARY